MKPAPFSYVDPETVDEALEWLTQFGDEAKLLAGGQSLVPLLNFRLARPVCLIDINRLAALDFVRPHAGGYALGGLTRQRTVEDSSELTGAGSLLKEAVRYIGHAQIRNRGTVGGSLAHADPAAELPAVATALGATISVRGPGGVRRLSPGNFFKSSFTTSLKPDEMLIELSVPAWPGRVGSSFHEVSRRAGDFAIVGVAVAVALDEAGRVVGFGVGICGASEVPLDGSEVVSRLHGQKLDSSAIRDIAGALAERIDPPTDAHGSGAYRRHLVRILSFRAIEEAHRRALALAL